MSKGRRPSKVGLNISGEIGIDSSGVASVHVAMFAMCWLARSFPKMAGIVVVQLAQLFKVFGGEVASFDALDTAEV